jgi:glutaredoxin
MIKFVDSLLFLEKEMVMVKVGELATGSKFTIIIKGRESSPYIVLDNSRSRSVVTSCESFKERHADKNFLVKVYHLEG